MKLFRGLMVGAIAATAMVGAGSAASATTNQLICGFHMESDGPWYGHCDAPPRTDVVIFVDQYLAADYKMCVRPGDHKLKPLAVNAWYIGQLCDAG
ncbi:DUF6355 family natural product biosynthesis protein [Amycolatopsis sp. cg5]|uniref:DUF6355 family natural product biosynthesis protein n=1 Tax=Amycolatopsis sp. cg5 TaxID=3238802 RepID=UPI003525420F